MYVPEVEGSIAIEALHLYTPTLKDMQGRKARLILVSLQVAPDNRHPNMYLYIYVYMYIYIYSYNYIYIYSCNYIYIFIYICIYI
jgi:hypothetical protein